MNQALAADFSSVGNSTVRAPGSRRAWRIQVEQADTLLPSANLIKGPSSQAKVRGCNRVTAESCSSITADIVWACGRVRYRRCLGTRPSRVGTAQRRHRVCNHLERPRWQRGKCRRELRAAVGRGVCWCTPLAREHHSDEHLEPLRTREPLLSITASVAFLRLCGIGCSHETGSVGVATCKARARLANSTVVASSGVLYACAVAQCAGAAGLAAAHP